MLNRYQRVPFSTGQPALPFQGPNYEDMIDPAVFEPTSPLRVIAGLLGGTGMAFMGMLLIVGAKHGGALDGITTENRMIMAGFACLLGALLLIYANPRARFKAAALSLLFGSGVISLPLFHTEGSSQMASNHVLPLVPDETLNPAPKSSKDDGIAELRKLIGTDPLTAEMSRLEAESSPYRAVGLWLREMQERNRFLIMEYVLRTTGADPQSHFYPRGNGNFLLVVTGVKGSLEEMSEIVKALGSVERVVPELSVIEVRVDNQNFVEGPIDKLTDQTSQEFYELNKRELESIDLVRIEKAVRRLGEAEPNVYRSDISRLLLSLLKTPDLKFKASVCRALEVWADNPQEAGVAALEEATAIMDQNGVVPVEMISLSLKSGSSDVALILDDLWHEDSNRWEAFYARAGEVAEPKILERFPDCEGLKKHSAVRLLGKVGGEKSLPILQEALDGADGELKVLLDNAIQAIRSRVDVDG